MITSEVAERGRRVYGLTKMGLIFISLCLLGFFEKVPAKDAIVSNLQSDHHYLKISSSPSIFKEIHASPINITTQMMAGPPSDPHNKIPGVGTAKPKKEGKSYWFDLKLCESNDETYPEFSWLELITERKNKASKERLSEGQTLLNPYASDDEDELKAMAARFEAKYNGKPTKNVKRKVQAEDYIDRGAGYDESDSFIDNTDVYDEVVPADLETVRGGFYINQGSLDFREVEISDEEVAADETKKNEKTVPVTSVAASTNASVKQTIKRPSLIVSKKLSSLPSKIKSKDGSKKASNTIVKVSAQITKSDTNNGVSKKSPSVQDSSSTDSSSSGSSSSEDSSSSSESSSSGEEEEDEEEEKKSTKEVQKPTPLPQASDSSPPVKRLKTKNVPPNPNLAKNKILTSSPSTIVNNSKEIIVTTAAPSVKISPHPVPSISPISTLGLTITPGISSMKVPTPKSTPTGSSTNSSSALNLVRSNKIAKPSKQHRHSSKTKMNIPLIAQLNQAAAADLMQKVALATSIAAASAAQNPSSKLKAKAKVKNLTSAKNLSKHPSSSHHHSQPPKLKAKPKMSTGLPPTMQLTSNLSQSMSPFGRITQPPPLSAQTVEITKIKPAHSNSSPSASHINSSIKSLSNLGSGITVTEVKEKSNQGSTQHSLLSAAVASSNAITVSSSNLSNNNPRSRSPNVVSSSQASARLSQSLTITPSSLLNLSTSGAHSSGSGNLTTSSSSNAGNITLANINMMPPSSRGNVSLFGQQSPSSSKKSITPFNVNNILSQSELSTPTSSSSKDFFDPMNLASMAIAYNRAEFFFGRVSELIHPFCHTGKIQYPRNSVQCETFQAIVDNERHFRKTTLSAPSQS
ncbi:unnamed protein product [Allacma fusca]|uniref:Hpc2-related domain-containing protein n=1 Tax=Allacma fusca TaxID=39272 RepID=A0A8J2JUF1_9HEXA|nr:unnamed protein product [Allacma fusca]